MKRLGMVSALVCILFGATAFTNTKVSLLPVIMKFNGIEDGEESTALIYKNRMYVPLKYVSQKFGADLSYDGESKVVSVVYPDIRTAKSEISSSNTSGPFKLSIYSKRQIYKTDEPIKVWADFTNVGQEKKIINSASLLFVFRITDENGGEMLDIGGLELLTHIFEPNDEYIRNMDLYHLNDFEAPFLNKRLTLPKGNYTIGAYARFGYKPEDTINLDSEIEIRVE
ncbi:stalk domain-containing protein [Cohnella lupini]|uniref:Copper amine oxidase-like protein n=1 Tax=Cohnella lupini TaxID=1294267 RepID=A0A3D9HZZ5_9BACL|nr:stalk domain-containing protein [Cohnella lupini]RED54486.1 copper amine oxidase-like protein [Cohnella lupini]